MGYEPTKWIVVGHDGLPNLVKESFGKAAHSDNKDWRVESIIGH